MRSHGLLQHFKPSERGVRARDDLLHQLTVIINERFGSGFNVEYTGIGRYATDIQQAPLEFAIVVCMVSMYISSADV